MKRGEMRGLLPWPGRPETGAGSTVSQKEGGVVASCLAEVAAINEGGDSRSGLEPLEIENLFTRLPHAVVRRVRIVPNEGDAISITNLLLPFQRSSHRINVSHFAHPSVMI